jgi:hypothetical protein
MSTYFFGNPRRSLPLDEIHLTRDYAVFLLEHFARRDDGHEFLCVSDLALQTLPYLIDSEHWGRTLGVDFVGVGEVYGRHFG